MKAGGASLIIERKRGNTQNPKVKERSTPLPYICERVNGSEEMKEEEEGLKST
jgi:hypothetical protein